MERSPHNVMRFFHGQLSHDRFLKTFIQVQLRCTSWAHVAGARNDRSFSLCVVHFVSPIRGMGWIVWVRSVSQYAYLLWSSVPRFVVH